MGTVNQHPWQRLAAFVSVGALAALTSVLPTAAADPTVATDDRGFVDSTARCAAPDNAVVFGRTANSRVAICKDPSGQYEYRGVRVSDGAKLVASAKPTGSGGFVAEQDGISYTVTSSALIISSGRQEIRQEQMVDFHGTGVGATPAPTSTTPTSTTPTSTTSTATTSTAKSTQPSAAPSTAVPTTPLPPPLPAEVGGG
jgi:hypothetical protein